MKSLASLLTALPLGGGSLDEAARSFYLVPLLALAVGAASASPSALAVEAGVGYIAGGAVYTLAYILLTGGIHMDGLADYSDVLGSRASGGEALRILKDPRKGAFAALALSLAIALSIVFPGEVLRLSSPGAFIILAASSHSGAAASMYMLLAAGPPEPYRGMARAFSLEARGRVALFAATSTASATASSAALALYGYPWWLVPLQWLSSLATGVWVLRSARSTLGYVNGDVAGFCFEASRIASIVATALALGVAGV
ncbi:adenosylcobinamide-GDP ribazoletransferase [Aeropyrum pernix]|uniref:adenosylcobinamide-GDP ribazoletransferase n=1 Tax=Aeropyrum pernix TaxID=56636 RepID=UPI00130527CE|nr:adenosylcobinamide-GDP ribazoletransferase [Aeropyrum pernix]